MSAGAGEGFQHVFVGDIQGCADEFDELLARLEDRFGAEFILHSVGDLVNRGPDNLRVLARMRELVECGRGRHVLGNHEVGLMAMLLEIRPLGERDTLGDVLASAEAPDWLAWLRERPVLEHGDIGGHPYAMVHASVSPDWTLAEGIDCAARVGARLSRGALGDLRDFLLEAPANAAPNSERDLLGRFVSCRGVRGRGWSSDGCPDAASEPWHAAWSRREHGYGVVYGHWATQGLHIAAGLRGLDTGCVHHGRGRDGFLTAWLPVAGEDSGLGEGPFHDSAPALWQIPARRRYYPY